VLYPAIIHKDAASDDGVSFPDFPGGVTAAPTPKRIKQRLLKDADAFAARHGTSRSALIAAALQERLARG
jgi:hypothetical protein